MRRYEYGQSVRSIRFCRQVHSEKGGLFTLFAVCFIIGEFSRWIEIVMLAIFCHSQMTASTTESGSRVFRHNPYTPALFWSDLSPEDAKPPLCKYFINGGCLRGDSCQFLHELPDERHLDVNGVGFIFNSNVHNAVQKPSGPTSGAIGLGRKQGRKQIPRYRPPEPHLEHNLPPALAVAFNTSPADVLSSLLRSMLDSNGVR